MKNVIVLLADGFEEMEAVLPIDLMRRAGISVKLVSLNNSLKVVGSRRIKFEADVLLSDIADDIIENTEIDAVFLPGGLDGSKNLAANPLTKTILKTMLDKGRVVAVMCAAPVIVLAPLGLLNGKSFTCYPGMEKESKYIQGADVSGYKNETVVRDGNLITSQGPGTAANLAFTLIETLVGNETSEKVKNAALFV